MLFKLLGVLVVLFIMLSVMYFIEYNNINMNPLAKPVKVEEIIVETFVPDDNIPSNNTTLPFDFCNEYRGNNNRLDNACNSIKDYGSCMEKKCCIWGGEVGLPNIKKNGNCLLGNEYGPLFKGSAFDKTEFYYQDQKYPLI
tara:strand:- start:1248 stop:1670 length:423 start_codon:yes stop_codon:yes gene_type:complete